MGGEHVHEDEIERALRLSRPTPSDEHIASIAAKVRAQAHRSSTRARRLGVVVFSAIALVALAATGGLTEAGSAAPKSVSSIVKKVFVSKPTKAKQVKKSSKSAATDQYGEKEKCNSGRGNGSEGNDSQLVDPHAGETGPGQTPTLDCDPGNSGGVNRGGD